MPVFDNPADQIVTEPPKSFQMKNNVLESLVREFFSIYINYIVIFIKI